MDDIQGFDSHYKLPVFAVELDYAAGPIIGQGALNVLLLGMASSATGNIQLNSEVRQVFQPADCDVAAGTGLQLDVMGVSAFDAIPAGANIFLAAVPEAVGAVAATFTAAISGSWTTSGQVTLAIGGKDINVTVGATDTPSQVATNIASAIGGTPNCAFSASPTTFTCTGTCKTKGLHGNQWVVVVDASLAPTGFVCTLTGSSALHTNENGVSAVFAGATPGSGTEDYTTILTKLTTKRWARIAPGANDATNAGLLKSFVRQQLAPLVQKYNMVVFGHNGTQSSATTLAQTTLNDPNCQVVAMRFSEAHPAEIAAGMAAVRGATESDDPVPDYDGYDCSAWIPPNRFDADSWLDAEANALLNSGVTPIHTQDNVAKVSRAITSYCLFNGGQDERCLDIGDAVFPAYAAIALQNLYWTQFRAANKYVRDDPDPREPEPPAGVGYPKLWKSTLQKQLADWRDAGWLEDTFSGTTPRYPVNAWFNKVAQRIQSSVNIVVARVQHQLGQKVLQTGPS